MTITEDQVIQMLIDARKDFLNEHINEGCPVGTCTRCNTRNSTLAQDWNDVGGPGTRMCEPCYIVGITCFWIGEAEAEIENAKQECRCLAHNLRNLDCPVHK